MQNNNRAKKFDVNNLFITYIINNYQFYNRIVIIYNNSRNVFILNINVIKKTTNVDQPLSIALEMRNNKMYKTNHVNMSCC